MPPLAVADDTLQHELDELREQCGVPGAVLGVLRAGATTSWASGVTRLSGGAPVTTDTRFLIASISKVWTATLVLQLVDEGLVDLDDCVNQHLDPPLRLGAPWAADEITVRQLLTHTGGFLGDAEEGNGDDVRSLVATYDTLPQLFAPGRLFSYSNAGFNVLGRLVECLRGASWDNVLEQWLLEPLRLSHTVSRVRLAAVLPIAVGHEPVAPGVRELQPVREWCDVAGTGPCGGTLATTAGDLLTFARLHIDDGHASDGRRLLGAEAVRLMREVQLPVPGLGISWGLGWEVLHAADPTVVGHEGNTCGQQSILTVIPERGAAFCLLTNGDPQGLLAREVSRRLLPELAGVEPPGPPTPSTQDDAPDPSRLAGRYRYSPDVHIDVRRDGGDLDATIITVGDTSTRVPTFGGRLRHAEGWTYVLESALFDEPQPVTFLWADGGGGPPTHLALGIRVAVRTATAP